MPREWPSSFVAIRDIDTKHLTANKGDILPRMFQDRRMLGDMAKSLGLRGWEQLAAPLDLDHPNGQLKLKHLQRRARKTDGE